MCGIAGLLDPRTSRVDSELRAVADAMADTMVPRGPDGSGVWVDPTVGVGLGHRRLSILDLSEHGAQPMASADGRWVITYNGEIYDHQQLAHDLRAAGVELRGHSDTEVLVEAVARWGVEATLERVDGMFAFGLWDRAQHRLTLARDRMGEKPLYYGTVGGGEVVFASTLDAIRAHPRFDRPIDQDALTLYFRHKYVPAPWSIYAGIHKLEPGCIVEISAAGDVGASRAYWSYFDVAGRGVTFQGSETEAVDELDRLLRRSVRRRLVADVPVGAFLSGGIDSSAVVAAAQKESEAAVRTFTIGSAEAGYDESTHARDVARVLGTDHTELILTEADALGVVDDLAGIWDEPFGDSSQIPSVLVSRLAREHVTVALTGDGGDELFAGYNRYVWAPAIWRRLHPVPVGLRRVAGRAGRRVPPGWWDQAAMVVPTSRRPRQMGLKAAKVFGVADAADEHEVFHRLVSHWQQPSTIVRNGTERLTLHTDPTGRPPVGSFVEHMCALDAVTYLPDDILAKVDRATMSVSLEGRVPFLDRAIVEFAAGLPLELKLSGGQGKRVLRDLLARSVPTELYERPKAGFGVPIETWLRGPLREWAESHLFGSAVSEYLDPEPVRRAWRDHQAGRRNNAQPLWDVVMFAAWWEGRS